MESEVTQSASFYKLWAWFETNKKQVMYGALGLLALGVIIWFVLWKQEQKRVAAGEALSNVFVPQMTGGAAGNRPDIANSLLKVANEYGNSSAGAQALLLAAGNLFDQGKYPEAQAQFEKFTREHRDNPLIGQALLGVAACLDAQGKANEALTAYKSLVDRHSGESVLPQAKFALARLYEAQNKPELAYPLLEDVARNNPYGSLGSEAGMKAEELKIKYPNLAPAKPASVGPLPMVTNTAPPKPVK